MSPAVLGNLVGVGVAGCGACVVSMTAAISSCGGWGWGGGTFEIGPGVSRCGVTGGAGCTSGSGLDLVISGVGSLGTTAAASAGAAGGPKNASYFAFAASSSETS